MAQVKYKPFKFPKYKAVKSSTYKPKWHKVNATVKKNDPYAYKPRKPKSQFGDVGSGHKMGAGLSPMEQMALQLMQQFQATEQKQQHSNSVGGFLGNVLGDVGDLGRGLAQAGIGLGGYGVDVARGKGNHDIVKDVKHVGQGIADDYKNRYGNLALSPAMLGVPGFIGGVEKDLLQGKSLSHALKRENPFTNAKQFVTDSNFHKFSQKVYDHPVPYILDAATVASAGGGVAGSAAKVAAKAGLVAAERGVAKAAVGTAEHTAAIAARDAARTKFYDAKFGPARTVGMKGSEGKMEIRLSRNPVTAWRQDRYLAAKKWASAKPGGKGIPATIGGRANPLHYNVTIAKKSAANYNKLAEAAARPLRQVENRVSRQFRHAPTQAAFAAVTQGYHPTEYLKMLDDAGAKLSKKRRQAMLDAVPIADKWLSHMGKPLSEMPKDVRRLEEFRNDWATASHEGAKLLKLDDYTEAQRNFLPMRKIHGAKTFEEFEADNPLHALRAADPGQVRHFRVGKDLIRSFKLDSKGNPVPLSPAGFGFGGTKMFKHKGKFVSVRPDIVKAQDLLDRGAVTFVRTIKHDKDHATAQFVDWKGNVIHQIEDIDPRHFSGSAGLTRKEIPKYFQNKQIKILRDHNGGRMPTYFRHQAESSSARMTQPKIAGSQPIGTTATRQTKGTLFEKGLAQDNIVHTFRDLERGVRTHMLERSIDEFYNLGRTITDQSDLRPGEVLLPADRGAFSKHVLDSYKSHEKGTPTPEGMSRQDLEASMKTATKESEATTDNPMVAVPRDLVNRHLAAIGFASNRVPKIIRSYTNVWKYGVLSMRPAFVVNNWVGNQIMATLVHPTIPLSQVRNSIADKLHKEDTKYGTNELLMQKHFNEATLGIGKTEKLHPKGNEGSQGIARAFFDVLDLGYRAVAMHETSLRKAIMTGLVKNDPIVKQYMKKDKNIVKAVDRYKKDDPEGFQQLHDGVVKHVDDIMGDYRYYGPMEQQLKVLIPFYGWYRHLMRYEKNLLDEHPASLIAQSQLAEQGAKKKDISFPDFMSAYVPLKSDNPIVNWMGMDQGRKAYFDTHNINPFATFADIADLAGGITGNRQGFGAMSSYNPLVSAAIEGITGRDPVSGMDLSEVGKKKGWLPALLRPATNIPPVKLLQQIQQDKMPAQPGTKDLLTPGGSISTKGMNKMMQHSTKDSILAYLGVPIKAVNEQTAKDVQSKATAKDRGYFATGIKKLEDKKAGVKKPRKKPGELTPQEKLQLEKILQLMEKMNG